MSLADALSDTVSSIHEYYLDSVDSSQMRDRIDACVQEMHAIRYELDCDTKPLEPVGYWRVNCAEIEQQIAEKEAARRASFRGQCLLPLGAAGKA